MGYMGILLKYTPRPYSICLRVTIGFGVQGFRGLGFRGFGCRGLGFRVYIELRTHYLGNWSPRVCSGISGYGRAYGVIIARNGV